MSVWRWIKKAKSIPNLQCYSADSAHGAGVPAPVPAPSFLAYRNGASWQDTESVCHRACCQGSQDAWRSGWAMNISWRKFENVWTSDRMSAMLNNCIWTLYVPVYRSLVILVRFKSPKQLKTCFALQINKVHCTESLLRGDVLTWWKEIILLGIS